MEYTLMVLRMNASTGSRNVASSPVGRVSGRRKTAASAGESVSALNAEIAIENAIVRENCLYIIPVVPGKKLTGTKTEISTSDVAMTALVTSAIATEVALCGSWAQSSLGSDPAPGTFIPSRWRCTFSMTTIASSTTRPVASVMPNSVSELMENPNILMNANVPMSETGIVIAGMMVARQSCRNRKMTMMTMMMASASVFSTSWIESETTVVESTAMIPFRPGGKDFCNSANTCLQRLSTSSALAFESCWTPIPTAFPWEKSRSENSRLVL